MLPPMEEAQPLEPHISFILSEFRLLNFFERHLRKLFNSIFHEQLNMLLLNLNLLLRIYTLFELLLTYKNSLPYLPL